MGFCYVLKSRRCSWHIHQLCAALSLACLAVQEYKLQEYEVSLLIFFIPIFSCPEPLPASLFPPFCFVFFHRFDCKDGRAAGACSCHTGTANIAGRTGPFGTPAAMWLLPPAACPWGLQHTQQPGQPLKNRPRELGAWPHNWHQLRRGVSAEAAPYPHDCQRRILWEQIV